MTTPDEPARPTIAQRLRDLPRQGRELFLRLARQHTGPGRLGAAVALGALLGTTPLFGLHMLMGAALGRLLRLNQVAILAGEQVSLPIFAPFLAFASVQTGHRMRYGAFLATTPTTFDLATASDFFADWLLGSLPVGAVLGAVLGVATAWVVRSVRRADAEGAARLGPRQRWTGRGRGHGLGFSLFLGTIRLLGRRGGYALLWLVLPYYVVFAPSARRASAAYLSRVLGPRGLGARWRDHWRHLGAFGRSMIDDMLLLAGRDDTLRYSSDGHDRIAAAYDEGRGVLLLSAHVGNRGLAGSRLNGMKVNVVAFENEAATIRRFLDRHSREDVPRVIEVSDGPAAAVSILSALKRGELVAILADRTRGEEVFTVPFLGRTADLPAGPFLVAVVSGAPTLVTFAPKLEPDLQHFYARPLPVAAHTPRAERRAAAEALARAYAQELEAFVRRWPYQWFNFYDYFGDSDPTLTDAGGAAPGTPDA